MFPSVKIPTEAVNQCFFSFSRASLKKMNERKKKSFLKAERTQTIIHFYAKPTSDHVVLALTTT
jgi:hypothetical protein